MRTFLLLTCLLWFGPTTAPAIAATVRYPVNQELVGKDKVTGREIKIPAHRGYTYVLKEKDRSIRVRVYDSTGFQVAANFSPPLLAGFFPLTTPVEGKDLLTGKDVKFAADQGLLFRLVGASTLQPAMRIFSAKGDYLGEVALPNSLNEADGLKKELEAGLKATGEGASSGAEVPGCCDVDDSGQKIEAEKIQSPPDDFVDVAPTPEPAAEPSTAAPELESVAEATPPLSAGRRPALERPSVATVKLPNKMRAPKWRPEDLGSAAAPFVRDKPRVPPVATAEEDDDDHPPARAPASRSLCEKFQAFKAQGVPEVPLRQAMAFLAKESRKFSGQKYFSFANYKQSSKEKRFYLLDLENLKVTKEKVAHGAGKGSSADPNRDGMLDKCGTSGSDRTRAGFFQVGDYYMSTRGRYRGWPLLQGRPPRNGMKLYGLTKGVNDSAIGDGYVMHEAKNNSATVGEIMWRSNGCPSFAPGRGKPIIEKLRGGSLHYNYAPVCDAQQKAVEATIPGWQNFCK